jgi:hypothetical protein
MRILTVLVIAIGVLVAPSANAEIKTISVQDTVDASNAGFGFTLVEQQFGSRCFGAKGQNNGLGLSALAVSEGLNAYAKSVCRHTGFGTKNLQNGWKVRSVSTTRTCQFNDFGTWKTLSSGCTFTLRTTPQAGAVSAFFDADVAIAGQFGQDRRHKLQWNIEIEGPAGTSPWTLQKPGAPVLSAPANGSAATTVATFRWTAPATGAANYKLCISRESFTGGCEVRATVTGTQASNVLVPFPGERVLWFVQACNSVGCTNSAESRRLLNCASYDLI